MILAHVRKHLSDGEWWACEHPERPHDQQSTVYASPCIDCGRLLQDVVAADPWANFAIVAVERDGLEV